VRAVGRGAYWGTAPGSPGLGGGQSRLSCCSFWLLKEKMGESLKQQEKPFLGLQFEIYEGVIEFPY
jgi:hypothetical protein